MFLPVWTQWIILSLSHISFCCSVIFCLSLALITSLPGCSSHSYPSIPIFPPHSSVFSSLPPDCSSLPVLSALSQIYCIENAHGQLVRDLDFNPNRQYYLASCGDDCKVKFWDIRNVQEPVKTLEEHSHWWVRASHTCQEKVGGGTGLSLNLGYWTCAPGQVMQSFITHHQTQNCYSFTDFT